MAQNPASIDPESFDNEEIGIARNLRRRKRQFSFNGLGFALLIVALVICSFWVSFFIGKKLLSPSQRFESPEIQAEETYTVPELPEKPVLAKKLPEVKKPVPVVVKKPKPVPVPVKKKVEVPAAPVEEAPEAPKVKDPFAGKIVKVVPVKGLFRVYSGSAANRDEAVQLRDKLKEAGYDSFIKDLGGGSFTLQAGAFTTKANAEKLAGELRSKGFSATITAE